MIWVALLEAHSTFRNIANNPKSYWILPFMWNQLSNRTAHSFDNNITHHQNRCKKSIQTEPNLPRSQSRLKERKTLHWWAHLNSSKSNFNSGLIWQSPQNLRWYTEWSPPTALGNSLIFTPSQRFALNRQTKSYWVLNVHDSMVLDSQTIRDLFMP